MAPCIKTWSYEEICAIAVEKGGAGGGATVSNANPCVAVIADPTGDTASVQRIVDEAGIMPKVAAGSQINYAIGAVEDENGTVVTGTTNWINLASDTAAGTWTNPSTCRSARVWLDFAPHAQIAANRNFVWPGGTIHGADIRTTLRINGSAVGDSQQLSYAINGSDEVAVSERPGLGDGIIVAPGVNITYGYWVQWRYSLGNAGAPGATGDHVGSIRFITPAINGIWDLV